MIRAEDVLDQVLLAGGRVMADPARPRLVVPPGLKPLVLEHRDALRALVLAGAAVPAVAAPSALAVPGAPRRPSYAFPWPDAVPGLGARTVGPYDPCANCARGSWVRYGADVLCCACAVARTATGPLPAVEEARG